jgi:transcriptional regulator with XRE-family HTH domain
MSNKKISPVGRSWDQARSELYTPEEIAASDFRVAIIGEIVKARQDFGVSQKKLEEMSGVKQPIIARMEKGTTSTQIDTILKVLAPLGKTLAVVDIKRDCIPPTKNKKTHKDLTLCKNV